MEKLENEIKELKGDVATQGDLTAIQGVRILLDIIIYHLFIESKKK